MWRTSSTRSNAAFGGLQQRVRITKRLEPIMVNVDTAIPLGLITTELLTNAYRYAFPDGAVGVIRVELTSHADIVELTVADNGVGLPQAERARPRPDCSWCRRSPGRSAARSRPTPILECKAPCAFHSGNPRRRIHKRPLPGSPVIGRFPGNSEMGRQRETSVPMQGCEDRLLLTQRSSASCQGSCRLPSGITVAGGSDRWLS